MASPESRRSKGTPSERKHSPAFKAPSKELSRSPVATPPSVRGSTSFEPKSAPVTQDAIAQAAYFRWLEKGGDPRTNWLEAEAELKAKAALGMV